MGEFQAASDRATVVSRDDRLEDPRAHVTNSIGVIAATHAKSDIDTKNEATVAALTVFREYVSDITLDDVISTADNITLGTKVTDAQPRTSTAIDANFGRWTTQPTTYLVNSPWSLSPTVTVYGNHYRGTPIQLDTHRTNR